MTRIMVCDPRPEVDESGRVAASLARDGYEVESYSDGARFLEAAVEHPPDLVVYALGAAIEPDLAVLRVLRRAKPDMELIVLAHQASLETRTAIQPLRPIFYSVGPLDPDEVVSVVQAAARRRERPR